VSEAPAPAADAPAPGKDGNEEEAPGGKKHKRSKKKKDKAAAAAAAVVDAWAPSAVAAAATLYSAAVRELSRERGCTLYQINALLGAKHAHAHALLFSLSVRNCVAAMAEGRALQASQQQGAEGRQLGQPPRLPACLLPRAVAGKRAQRPRPQVASSGTGLHGKRFVLRGTQPPLPAAALLEVDALCSEVLGAKGSKQQLGETLASTAGWWA
jgi:hypothetical protein